MPLAEGQTGSLGSGAALQEAVAAGGCIVVVAMLKDCEDDCTFGGDTRMAAMSAVVPAVKASLAKAFMKHCPPPVDT